ncbi:MAG: formyltransferase family protein [Phycisphaerae bacterium]|nr:formyltransferase family protein [Phycisphaerae bacterium]
MLRIGGLISGGGRTAVNLAERLRSDAIDASIEIVIAHRADVPGVARCRAAGLHVAITDGPGSVADQLDALLQAHRVELVCLCGYLRKFRVAPLWSGRTINIHPALLPDFGGPGMYGDRVHAAVLRAGVSESGCTVHSVDEDYDCGQILLQRRCPVVPGDSSASLAARVFAEECRALPEVVARIASGVISFPMQQVSA